MAPRPLRSFDAGRPPRPEAIQPPGPQRRSPSRRRSAPRACASRTASAAAGRSRDHDRDSAQSRNTPGVHPARAGLVRMVPRGERRSPDEWRHHRRDLQHRHDERRDDAAHDGCLTVSATTRIGVLVGRSGGMVRTKTLVEQSSLSAFILACDVGGLMWPDWCRASTLPDASGSGHDESPADGLRLPRIGPRMYRFERVPAPALDKVVFA